MKMSFAQWWAAHKPTKRRLIQVYAALLTNANLKGFQSGKIYQGDVKSVCVPGLNCYSCPGAAAACPLGALQNSLAQANVKAPFYVLGILMLFGVLFGRWICGFLCPFGLIQDLLYKIKSPKLKKNRVTKVLSYLKYVILVFFVILVPLTYSLHGEPAMPAFCKFICPSGTLLGAVGLMSNPANEYMLSMLGPLFTWKFCLLVGIVTACIFLYRPFCRFLCPLGAIYGIFNRFALLGIQLDKPKCIDCGLCTGKCKMDIRHVGDHECISCGDYVGVCPTGAISMKGPKILLAPNEVGGNPAAKDVPPVLPRKTKIARAAVAAVMTAVLIFALVWFNAPESIEPPVTGPTDPTGQEITVGSNVGQLCTDYELPKLLEDGTFRISDFRGKITVLNFWGTWCPGCVSELKTEFPQLFDAYGDQINVLTIHSNYQEDGVDPQAFIDKNFGDTPYHYAIDIAGEDTVVQFGGGQTWPHTVILDADGIIIAIIPRETTFKELQGIIDPLLNP